MHSNPPDDNELMARVRDDDVEAFREISRRHSQRIYAYLLRLVGEEALAADLQQDALFQLWQARSRWKANGSIQGYLIRAARSLAYNALRHQRVRNRWFVAQGPTSAAEAPSPEVEWERRELAVRVNTAIEALPDRPREIFSLKRDAGLSYREIGELLGIAPKTVEVHMSRALRMLREALADLRESRGER